MWYRNNTSHHQKEAKERKSGERFYSRLEGKAELLEQSHIFTEIWIKGEKSATGYLWEESAAAETQST